jgi:cytochrome c-type biogenesis protein CcmF
VTLWGVLFPLTSEFAQNETVTVSTPYFNRINGPLLLALIALMGIGPVLPWRRATMVSVKRWLLWPAAIAVLTFSGLLLASALFASGLDNPIALFAFSVLTFVAAAVAEEWYRGSAARHRSGDSWPTAFWRLLNGNRPRHGGYIVHLSILMLAFGVVGTQFFDQRTEVVLDLGQTTTFDNYTLTFVDHQTEERRDRLAQWAVIDVTKNGNPVGQVKPWNAFYPVFNQVSVRAGIRGTPIEDLYVVPTDFLDAEGRGVAAGGGVVRRVVLRLSINPLAWWLWAAGPIFILGTVVALWPHPTTELRTATATRRRAAARPPLQGAD